MPGPVVSVRINYIGRPCRENRGCDEALSEAPLPGGIAREPKYFGSVFGADSSLSWSRLANSRCQPTKVVRPTRRPPCFGRQNSFPNWKGESE